MRDFIHLETRYRYYFHHDLTTYAILLATAWNLKADMLADRQVRPSPQLFWLRRSPTIFTHPPTTIASCVVNTSTLLFTSIQTCLNCPQRASLFASVGATTAHQSNDFHFNRQE